MKKQARPKTTPGRETKVPAKIRPEIIVVVATIAVLTLLVLLCHDNTPFWLGKPVATPVAQPWIAESADPATSSNPDPVQYRTLEKVLRVEFTPLPHPYTELTITIGGFGPRHPGTLPDWAR